MAMKTHLMTLPLLQATHCFKRTCGIDSWSEHLCRYEGLFSMWP